MKPFVFWQGFAYRVYFGFKWSFFFSFPFLCFLFYRFFVTFPTILRNRRIRYPPLNATVSFCPSRCQVRTCEGVFRSFWKEKRVTITFFKKWKLSNYVNSMQIHVFSVSMEKVLAAVTVNYKLCTWWTVCAKGARILRVNQPAGLPRTSAGPGSHV